MAYLHKPLDRLTPVLHPLERPWLRRVVVDLEGETFLLGNDLLIYRIHQGPKPRNIFGSNGDLDHQADAWERLLCHD